MTPPIYPYKVHTFSKLETTPSDLRARSLTYTYLALILINRHSSATPLLSQGSKLRINCSTVRK